MSSWGLYLNHACHLTQTSYTFLLQSFTLILESCTAFSGDHHNLSQEGGGSRDPVSVNCWLDHRQTSLPRRTHHVLSFMVWDSHTQSCVWRRRKKKKKQKWLRNEMREKEKETERTRGKRLMCFQNSTVPLVLREAQLTFLHWIPWEASVFCLSYSVKIMSLIPGKFWKKRH